MRRLLELAVANSTTIAENDEVIGNLVKFVELVADEEDGFALRLQPLDNAEEIIDFLAR